MKKRKHREGTIELTEVWTPEGRHYFRFPDGREVDIPAPQAAFDPNEHVFHDGQWTTSARKP